MVSFDAPLHMSKYDDLIYTITYCNLGSKLLSKVHLSKLLLFNITAFSTKTNNIKG